MLLFPSYRIKTLQPPPKTATDNLRVPDVHSATTSRTVQKNELINLGKKHDSLVKVLTGKNKDNLANEACCLNSMATTHRGFYVHGANPG